MFRTQNYTVIECDKCYARTVFEPHTPIEKLNCKCEAKDEEINSRTDNQAKRQRKKAQGDVENAS